MVKFSTNQFQPDIFIKDTFIKGILIHLFTIRCSQYLEKKIRWCLKWMQPPPLCKSSEFCLIHTYKVQGFPIILTRLNVSVTIESHQAHLSWKQVAGETLWFTPCSLLPSNNVHITRFSSTPAKFLHSSSNYTCNLGEGNITRAEGEERKNLEGDKRVGYKTLPSPANWVYKKMYS